MVQSMRDAVPSQWSGVVDALAAPVAWLPDWNRALINLAWYGGSTTEVLFKRGLLLLPILLVIAGMWSTMASLYTLPFRSGRGGFVTSMLMTWWDAARAVWFLWAGAVRLGVVIAGWLWSALRFTGTLLRTAFRSPMNFMDWTTRNYFKPGVPWLAFIGLLAWSAVEALVFTYTLRPTMTEVLAGMTGFEPDPRWMTPILWVILNFLILGSFASIQGMVDVAATRQLKWIFGFLAFEFLIMGFEVMFLYREMVDALTPWIEQQTGVGLGLGWTLGIAGGAWFGVRGMTWFLFGRWGTPALLAVMGRGTLEQSAAPKTPIAPPVDPWKGSIEVLKAEVAWFKAEARNVFELLSLPVLQMVAAAVNFAVVAVTSRPVFSLPFTSLDQAMAAAPRFGRSGDATPDVPLHTGSTP